ncbi:MAG: SecDF P1 head subdomain-containing protein [Cellulomonas sp.]
MLHGSFFRPVALVATVLVLAGCASTGGVSAAGSSSPTSTAPTLQLRLVDSSTDGPCSEPPLPSDAHGSACDESGTTTYQVGASLGAVTPTSVTYPGGEAERQMFTIQFDQAGSTTLADVSRAAIGQQLALLVEGRVLTAAKVLVPITGGQFELATTTPAQASTAAAALHASATP